MRLLKLIYLLLQHPFHLHRWLVRRGLYQGWINDFIPFWNTIRPVGLPITDYASYTWMEYYFTTKFRERLPSGDHFEDTAAQYARLLSFVKRREMHPLRMLKVAWTLRKAERVLEYGAGSAPYAHFVERCWPTRQWVLTYDLPKTLLQQYQHWRWPTIIGMLHGNIGSLYSDPLASAYSYDAIVCTEVFEHLQGPLETALKMMDAAPLICFDYIDEGDNDLIREFVLSTFKHSGDLTGPDKRGLYVWRRHQQYTGPVLSDPTLKVYTNAGATAYGVVKW